MDQTKLIYLTEEQQEQLRRHINYGTHTAQSIKRARVLLMLDRTGKADHVRYKRTAEAVGLSTQAIYDMRDDFLAKRDIEAYLTRKKREHGPREKKLDVFQEAKIIALACSEAPAGRARWSIALLKNKAIELRIVDSIGDSTIERLLKKRNISLI